MSKKKGVLQKLSLIFGVLSFLLSAVTGIWLYLRIESVGPDNPVSASLMATTFFLICVGVILTIIGRADIPSFKFDE